jgi:serine/threonine protein kinase
VHKSDYQAIRRTTMCGISNYLAPEVLEKTREGHDGKVDLWAICKVAVQVRSMQDPNVSRYTVAAGRAPLYALRREDMYRTL